MHWLAQIVGELESSTIAVLVYLMDSRARIARSWFRSPFLHLDRQSGIFSRYYTIQLYGTAAVTELVLAPRRREEIVCYATNLSSLS